jgi:hypothetical protein
MSTQSHHDEQLAQLVESMNRLEARTDVALSRQEQRLEELTRRVGEQIVNIREHDTRIAGITLSLSKTRAAAAAAATGLESLRVETRQAIGDLKPRNLAAWVAVAVAALALVITPMLTALMTR